MRKNVTIVIPVYKDWTTLEKCITSLKKYVDNRHAVFLINDNGEEADFLENKIKEIIAGRENFKYFRNKENMGFVKTCNRAVFELDKTENDILLLNSDTETTENFLEEMLDVMSASDRHGVVCPRSNNATILSVPFLYDGERSEIIERSFESWQKIKDKLPRFRKIPTGVGFCMLIRRDLIKNFGLFDEIYGKGYNEENDFCCRINRFGYSVAMANRAFVFHFEGKSFSQAAKLELNIKNSKILLGRYPEYAAAVEKYYGGDVDPVDYFTDILTGMYPKKRILFSICNLPSLHNGTSEYGISLLRNFHELFHDKYDIDVLTNEAGDKFHGLSKDFNVIYFDKPEGMLKRYDLAISPTQIFNPEHLAVLNKRALRIMVTMQDIIFWRSNYLNTNEEFEFAMKSTMQFSDGLIAISRFVRDDMAAYFSDLKINDKIKVVYHGINPENYTQENVERAPFEDDGYVLIIGNHFKHKMIASSVEALKETRLKYVIVGMGKNGLDFDPGEDFVFFRSGNLSDAFLNNLYRNCRLILFPSQYEGFGLPILKALKFRKKIIFFDNDLNRELAEQFKISSNQAVFFRYFMDLSTLVSEAFEDGQLIKEGTSLRTWGDVAQDTEVFMETVLAKKIEPDKLRERWSVLNYWLYKKKELSILTARRVISLSGIFSGLAFVAFHPRKSLTICEERMKNLYNAWLLSFKTEGFGKSLKRTINYVISGAGTLD
jgi:GT2 family glycosyltransferase